MPTTSSGVRRTWILVAVLTAIAVALLVAVRDLTPLRDQRVVLPWWVVLAAMYVVETQSVTITTRHGRQRQSLVEAAVAIGLFTTTPMALVAGTVLASLPAFGRLRSEPVKLAINVLQAWLWTEVTILIFHAVAGGSAEPDVAAWGGALLGSAIGWAGSAVVVQVAIGFLTGTWERAAKDRNTILVAGLVTMGATAVALTGVVLAADSPVNLLLLIAPIGLIALSTTMMQSTADMSAALDFTVASSDALRRGRDPAALIEMGMEPGRAAFGAEDAHLYLAMPHAEPVLRSASRTAQATEGEPMPAQDAIVAWLEAHGELGPVKGSDPTAAEVAAEIGHQEFILSPVTSRVHGPLAVIAMIGRTSGSFRDAHLELCRTLGSTASAAIDRTLARRDLEAAARRQQELERRALHDGLTGLPNREFFERELQAAIEAGTDSSVLFLDMNGFKAVNDTHGHEVGDQLLTVVADRIRSSLRPSDLAARLGGDEFVVLVGADLPIAEVVGQRILAALDAPLPSDLTGIGPLSAAIGAAPVLPGQTIADVLRQADGAMYRAKREDLQTVALAEGA